jgi:hypothetical protein
MQDLSRTNRILTSLVLGIPESEIQMNAFSSGRTSGKVNITADHHAPPGSHGVVLGQGEVDFRPGLQTAFDINASELDKPGVSGILFHEVSHLKDYELAQQWVKNYEAETKRPFVGGASGASSLRAWLNAQVAKNRLTRGDAELVADEALDVPATTEARANVRTFLAVLQAGRPDQATTALVNYAWALAGTKYAAPPTGSHVLAELVAELKAAYRHMSKSMQGQFDAAVRAAMKECPDAWLSALKFSR